MSEKLSGPLQTALRGVQMAWDVAALAEAMSREFAGIHDTAYRNGLGTDKQMALCKNLADGLADAGERTRESAAAYWDALVRGPSAETEGRGPVTDFALTYRLASGEVTKLLKYLQTRHIPFSPLTASVTVAAREQLQAAADAGGGDRQRLSAAMRRVLTDAADDNHRELYRQWFSAHGTNDSFFDMAVAALTVSGAALSLGGLRNKVDWWKRDHPQQAAVTPREGPAPLLSDVRLESALAQAQTAFGIAAFLDRVARELRVLGDARRSGGGRPNLRSSTDNSLAHKMSETATRLRRAAGQTWAATARQVVAEHGGDGSGPAPEPDIRGALRDTDVEVYDRFVGALSSPLLPDLRVRVAAEAHLQSLRDRPRHEADLSAALTARWTEQANSDIVNVGDALLRRFPVGADLTYEEAAADVLIGSSLGRPEDLRRAQTRRPDPSPAHPLPRAPDPLRDRSLHLALGRAQRALDAAAVADAAAGELVKLHTAAYRSGAGEYLLLACHRLATRLHVAAEHTRATTGEYWRGALRGDAPVRKGVQASFWFAHSDVGLILAHLQKTEPGSRELGAGVLAAARAHASAPNGPWGDGALGEAVIHAMCRDARSNAPHLYRAWAESRPRGTDVSLLAFTAHALGIGETATADLGQLRRSVAPRLPVPLRMAAEALADARMQEALADAQITFAVAALILRAAGEPGTTADEEVARHLPAAAARLKTSAVGTLLATAQEVVRDRSDGRRAPGLAGNDNWIFDAGGATGPSASDRTIRGVFVAALDALPRPGRDVQTAAEAYLRAALDRPADPRSSRDLIAALDEQAEADAVEMGDALLEAHAGGPASSLRAATDALLRDVRFDVPPPSSDEAPRVPHREESTGDRTRTYGPDLTALEPQLATALREAQKICDIAAFVDAAMKEVDDLFRAEFGMARPSPERSAYHRDMGRIQAHARRLRFLAGDDWNIAARTVALMTLPTGRHDVLWRDISALRTMRKTRFPQVDNARVDPFPERVLRRFDRAGANFGTPGPDVVREALDHLAFLRTGPECDLTVLPGVVDRLTEAAGGNAAAMCKELVAALGLPPSRTPHADVLVKLAKHLPVRPTPRLRELMAGTAKRPPEAGPRPPEPRRAAGTHLGRNLARSP